MGRKPLQAGRTPSRRSLPLMGIENLTVTADAQRTRCGALITPHGDRKRDAVPRRRATALQGSHYPSWGSKTCRRMPDAGPACTALHAHGDRKRSRSLTSASPRTVLITPHGDRTRPHGSRAGQAPQALITPHGDRKPPVSRPRRRLTDLITPHGDRKLPSLQEPLLPRPHPPTHYPSWGSKTSEAQLRYAKRHRIAQLITPHGDRK